MRRNDTNNITIYVTLKRTMAYGRIEIGVGIQSNHRLTIPMSNQNNLGHI